MAGLLIWLGGKRIKLYRLTVVRLLQDHLRFHCFVADCGIDAELQDPLYAKDGQ